MERHRKLHYPIQYATLNPVGGSGKTNVVSAVNSLITTILAEVKMDKKVAAFVEWLQIVNISSAIALCKKCNNDLTVLGNFLYDGEVRDSSTTRDELCCCKKCGTRFVLHYNLFDFDGHICDWVMVGDPNDPGYNWQSQLTSEQQIEVGKHLENCGHCSDNLTAMDLWNAEFASILHSQKNSRFKHG